MLSALYVADRSLPRTGAKELAAGSDLAAEREDGAVTNLEGRAEAETAAEGEGDLVAAGLGEVGDRAGGVEPRHRRSVAS